MHLTFTVSPTTTTARGCSREGYYWLSLHEWSSAVPGERAITTSADIYFRDWQAVDMLLTELGKVRQALLEQHERAVGAAADQDVEFMQERPHGAGETNLC
jgi:hypothetical protein